MLRKVFALLIAAGLLAALGGAGSAIFTDSKDVGSNTFTTGTVVLTTNPTSALVK